KPEPKAHQPAKKTDSETKKPMPEAKKPSGKKIRKSKSEIKRPPGQKPEFPPKPKAEKSPEEKKEKFPNAAKKPKAKKILLGMIAKRSEKSRAKSKKIEAYYLNTMLGLYKKKPKRGKTTEGNSG
ncbi:hypothetical protein JXA56_03545, partial [Candidatus Micrarchaeota archaeon]|nr:hypothetical protein [Candidatus Micrarchaeota archaeon]